jgi:hypothetical protein
MLEGVLFLHLSAQLVGEEVPEDYEPDRFGDAVAPLPSEPHTAMPLWSPVTHQQQHLVFYSSFQFLVFDFYNLSFTRGWHFGSAQLYSERIQHFRWVQAC